MPGMGIDGRALPHDALELLRLRAAEEFAKGTPTSQIAAMVGMTEQAVNAWRRKWRSGGKTALAAKPVPGRPGSLSAGQLAELASLIRDHTPADYGFAEALWTRALVAALIEQRFGFSFQPSWTGKLLHRMGFTPQRPKYRATEQDPQKVAAWRTQVYPAIRTEAAQVGATIYFLDEAHLRADYHAGTTWAPAGITPVVQAMGRRDPVTMISAIEQRGRIHFSCFTGIFDKASFIGFCEKVLADDGGTVFLILDGAPSHRAKDVKTFVESTGGRLRLFFLPSYSPTLNPDEWVWSNVKAARAGRRAVQAPGQLHTIAVEALERLAATPDIIRGFFRDPDLDYLN